MTLLATLSQTKLWAITCTEIDTNCPGLYDSFNLMSVGWECPPTLSDMQSFDTKCSCEAWCRSDTAGMAVEPPSIRTPLLCFDLDDIRGGPVPYRSEGQDTDAVGGACDEAAHGGEVAVISVVFLPHAQRQVRVGGVVHAVPSDLSIGLLRLLPLHQHGAGTQHPCLHFEGRT